MFVAVLAAYGRAILAARVRAAVGIDFATVDYNGGTAGILSTANACRVIAAVGFNIAAIYLDVATILISIELFAAANASRYAKAFGINFAAISINVATVRVPTSTDTRTA